MDYFSGAVGQLESTKIRPVTGDNFYEKTAGNIEQVLRLGTRL